MNYSYFKIKTNQNNVFFAVLILKMHPPQESYYIFFSITAFDFAGVTFFEVKKSTKREA